MNKVNTEISLPQAARIAGVVTLIMVFCAPFCEIYAYPKLIDFDDKLATVRNIYSHQRLFAVMIFGYVITFIGDMVGAWALFFLMRPVNNPLSVLTALFRLVFAVVAIVSLINLVEAFRWVSNSADSTLFTPEQLGTQVLLSATRFRYGFHFGLIFFGIHLGLLGYLVWKSNYIPSVLGVLLAISGVGYFVSAIQPYFFPSVNINLATYTFFGELIFIFWLLIRGSRIP